MAKGKKKKPINQMLQQAVIDFLIGVLLIIIDKIID